MIAVVYWKKKSNQVNDLFDDRNEKMEVENDSNIQLADPELFKNTIEPQEDDPKFQD